MRTRIGRTLVALALAAPLIAVVAPSAPIAAADPVCELGNGIQHVVEITFDNVHFFRDNPNMPSDLELMPHLNDFIQDNGVMLSNNHTPLIAHTAEDSLAIYTGLYGDRHGMPISNTYRTWKPNGTVASAGSFVYWTDPNNDGGNDTEARDDLLGLGPGLGDHDRRRDAGPVGAVDPSGLRRRRRLDRQHGARERALRHPEGVRAGIAGGGRSSPPTRTRRSSTSRPPTTSGSPCTARRAARSARTRKRSSSGRVTPSHTAVTDSLPDEPGGYTGYQALFGHKYIAPQLGAGTADLIAQRLPGDERRREPRRPERQPDQRRVPRPRRTPRASRGSARSWPGRRSRTPPTCSRRAFRWSTATSATSTSARRGSRAARRRRPPRPATPSVPATPATSRPPTSTTRRSRRSSPAWPPPASTRATRCSCSARRRTTSSTARTSAARSSRRAGRTAAS